MAHLGEGNGSGNPITYGELGDALGGLNPPIQVPKVLDIIQRLVPHA